MKNKTQHLSLLMVKLFFLFGLFSFVSGCEYADVLDDLLEKDKDKDDTEVFMADLDALNDSGVSGHATLTLKGNKLTVKIKAEGLQADSLHPQHIHGLENNQMASCPPASADMNGNGLVEIGEGLPFYGPVLFPLTPLPNASKHGRIHYEHTFTLGEGETISKEDLMKLENRVIVLHGMIVDGKYMASLPVACGKIMMEDEDY